jgi:hypothetical protein
VLGEFADPETGLLSPSAIKLATREQPLELPVERHSDIRYGAAIDPGDGRWTLVIVQRKKTGALADENPYSYRVALAVEYRSTDANQVWPLIAKTCARYGVTRAATDQYAPSEVIANAKRARLDLEPVRWTEANKLEDFLNLATLLHSGRLELAPDRVLRADLLKVKKRTTQNGFKIAFPRTPDGRHCDFAPALAAAIRHVRDNAPFRYARLAGSHPADGIIDAHSLNDAAFWTFEQYKEKYFEWRAQCAQYSTHVLHPVFHTEDGRMWSFEQLQEHRKQMEAA